jgi:hypothetical protein
VGYLQEVFFVLEKQLVNIPYVIDTFGKQVKIDETLDILIESGIDLLTMYFTPRSESFTEVSQLTKNGKVYNQKLVLDIPSTSIENAATIQAIGNNKVFLYFRDRNGKFKFLRNMLMTSQLELSEAHRTRLTFEFQSKLPAKFIDIASAVNITNAVLGSNALCTYYQAGRKNKLYKVEDFPRQWIALYHNTFKGNTFKIEGTGCVNFGGVSDYAAITGIDIRSKSLTTNFTAKLMSKFFNLQNLNVAGNSIEILDLSKNYLLETLNCQVNDLTNLDTSNNPLLDTLLFRANDISALDISNNPLLTFLRVSSNNLNASVNSQLLIDLDSHGLSNGNFTSHITGGGSLTTAGSAAKTALQGKGWSIVGL